MPMIDVYAVAGKFSQPHAVAGRLAEILMRIEDVPNIAMFRKNTAAFIHELAATSISNVEPRATTSGCKSSPRQEHLTGTSRSRSSSSSFALVAEAAGDDSLRERSWVLLTEAVAGGWGLRGHAHTNDELIEAARAESLICP